MSISGCFEMASPTSAPVPVTRLNTPAGQADVVDDLGEDEGVERGDLAGLEHDGAAGGHRVGDLGGDLVERVVPRRDAADDADRLLDDEAVADGGLVLVALGERGGGVERVDRQAGLHHEAQPLRHARLAGDDGGDLVHAGAEALGDAGAVLGPLLGALGRPVGEGGAGGLGGGVDVGGVAVRDAPDHLAVGGVEHVDGARSRRTAPTRRRCRSCRAPALRGPLWWIGRWHGPVARDAIAGSGAIAPRRAAEATAWSAATVRPCPRPSEPGPLSDEVSLRIEAPPERCTTSSPTSPRWAGSARSAPAGSWLDDATGPAVGARFKGSNKRGFARWSTTNKVVEAEPGPGVQLRDAPERHPVDLPDGARRRRHASSPRAGPPSRTARCSPRCSPRCSSAASTTTTTRCATACARPSSASRPSPSRLTASVHAQLGMRAQRTQTWLGQVRGT